MTEKRKAHRVVFEKGFAANMMAIDGTWRRPCTIMDVSDTGAKLTIDGPIDGIALKEFFLVLSSMGTAYRRCDLAWVNGNQVGVHFIKPSDKEKAITTALLCNILSGRGFTIHRRLFRLPSNHLSLLNCVTLDFFSRTKIMKPLLALAAG